MVSVLETFRPILFEHSQWCKSFKSIFSLFLNAFRVVRDTRSAVSSAKMNDLPYLRHFCRSSMYSRKNRGPRTDPWGTPQFMGMGLEATFSTETYCFLSKRYELTHLLVIYLWNRNALVLSIRCCDRHCRKPFVSLRKRHMKIHLYQAFHE